MSKSAAVGTQLKVGTGSAAKVVGGLKSIGGIDVSAETIDVTALDNSDGYREKVAGFKDGGEVPVSGFLDGADAGQSQLYTLLASGAKTDFSIVFPAAIGKQWDFEGVVVGYSTSADVGDAVAFEATIAVSGEPTLSTTPTSGGGGT